MDSKKPSLMLAVLDGLKKKGKMDKSSSEKPEDDSSDQDSYREHLEQISKELISAVHDKDHVAVADLLEEAFECFDKHPHEEGPHPDEDSDSKY